jgi:hypothetical protein
MTITKQQYVEYVISTPVNYTCTNVAAHLENVSHDAVNDYLRREKHTAHTLWELAEPLINNSSESYLVLDDSVQDKNYSKKMVLRGLLWSQAK